MHRLLTTLKRKKFSLIASLPENSYEMAKIAWETGADAIKVHINVFHRASQNTFGPLTEIRNTFERIIADSPVPVGIVAGEDPILVEELLDDIVAMGFDFISLYGHFMPASLVERRDITTFSPLTPITRSRRSVTCLSLFRGHLGTLDHRSRALREKTFRPRLG